MARGWESKSVEAQQEAAQRPAHVGPPISRGQAEVQSQRAVLMLARARTEADLRAATNHAHRSMLERALADLDRRIAALDT